MQYRDPIAKNPAVLANAKEAEQRAKRLHGYYFEALRRVMSTNEGRRVLWHVLKMSGHEISSFHHSGSVTFFNEGQRNVGLKLLSDLKQADFHGFQLMEKEAEEDLKNG